MVECVRRDIGDELLSGEGEQAEETGVGGVEAGTVEVGEGDFGGDLRHDVRKHRCRGC
jgi:hypothetical protein